MLDTHKEMNHIKMDTQKKKKEGKIWIIHILINTSWGNFHKEKGTGLNTGI